MSPRLGELAALGAALGWSISSIFFTKAGQRVGSVMVSRTRLAFAVVLVAAAHWALYGRPFPLDAEPFRWGWLSLSAVIGLALGDTLLFQCYLLVGVRVGVLLTSLSPVFGVLLAWLTLGEALTAAELAAIGLALGGVAWVVLERQGAAGHRIIARRDYYLGILCGIAAAFCQAANLVIAKRGLAGDFPPLSAVVMRLSVAAVGMWLVAALRGEFGRSIRRVRAEPRAAWAILCGTITGTCIGIWLSMTAVQSAPIGIASTLMAMTPVLSLPLVHRVFGERITLRAILGTIVALAGVALLFLT